MFNVVLNFLLFALVEAAPVAAQRNNHMGFGIGGGIVGFIVLVLDIIVWIEVLQSSRTVLGKVGWCALVFLFPVGGMIIYYLFSNRTAHRGGGYEIIG